MLDDEVLVERVEKDFGEEYKQAHVYIRPHIDKGRSYEEVKESYIRWKESQIDWGEYQSYHASFVNFNGKDFSVAEFATLCGIEKEKVRKYLNDGWSTREIKQGSRDFKGELIRTGLGSLVLVRIKLVRINTKLPFQGG